MATRYVVHPKYRNKETLITTVDDQAVNLVGKPAQKVVPARGDAESYSVTIPAATQAQMKVVHERGEKDAQGDLIVIIEDSPAPDTKK